MSCLRTKFRGWMRGRLRFAALPLLVLLPLAAASLPGKIELESEGLGPMTCQVIRGEFLHEVRVRGELESAVNVEVCCEVRTGDGSSIRILEVVPEGVHVQPGDFLVRLDSSKLELDRLRQQILCEQVEALVVEAQSQLRIAEAARREYLEGEYALRRQEGAMALFMAEENLRRASRYLEYSRQMAARGYITPMQLENDAFEVQSAEHARRLAQTRLDVLENYTRPKRLRELDGLVAVRKVRLASLERIRRIHQENLAEIDAQIAKCVVRAPVAGQVVLAHLHHHGHSHMVTPGEVTRENRPLVRLPDPRRMQVKAEVSEEKIALIRVGSPVTLALDAFPHRELRGTVARVHEYPNPDTWFGPDVKRYETIVRLEPSDLPLRPGLTAEMRVCVARMKDQLMVPSLALLKEGQQYCCLSVAGGRWETREVVPGPSNGKFTVIRRGLSEGERVVLGAAAYRDKVRFAGLPPANPPAALADTRRGSLRNPVP